MLLQMQTKDKRGISVMVGYVLLVTFAIIISVIVYNWMQSYVPQEDLECEDGVSLIIQEYTCDLDGSGRLNITLRNNGLFSLDGIVIHAKNNTQQEIATIDLSNVSVTNQGENFSLGKVIFSSENKNSLKPDEKRKLSFDLNSLPEEKRDIKEIEIIPVKYVESGEKNLQAICGKARIAERVNC